MAPTDGPATVKALLPPEMPNVYSTVRSRDAAGSVVVVIPAYKPPADVLAQTVSGLAGAPHIAAVVVVNDGSGPEYEPAFQDLAALDGVFVLAHAVNLGKGAALKTALNYVACAFPNCPGVVTADADGQHAVEDILATAEELIIRPSHLVLGARAFEGNVPLRSRLGNSLTRYVLRAVTGQRISDTQSGLRGIPMAFVPELLRLEQNGYEFELEMLLASKRAMRRIAEVPIKTIYREANRSSHFNPLRDSMRIYFLLIRFAAVSLAAAALDNIIFALAFHAWPDVLACQVLSRTTAGLFQYYSNKGGVFHSRVGDKHGMPRYWLTWAFLGTLSYALLNTLHEFSGMPVTTAKLAAETILFAFSFVIQRDWVFARRAAPDGATDP